MSRILTVIVTALPILVSSLLVLTAGCMHADPHRLRSNDLTGAAAIWSKISVLTDVGAFRAVYGDTQSVVDLD